MELEVGLRRTRDAQDLTFASTETEDVFIIAAHLPGFTKDEIDVDMNEGEKQISIRGGGHIVSQEAVITSRVAITREVSVECFDEAFPVPDCVDWVGIDAWFDEEEKILIISIPKLITDVESGMPHSPSMPEESIGIPPEKEQLQPGAPDVEEKTTALPQYPESKEHLQVMQEPTERLDEEQDEATREHVTHREKRPMQTEEELQHTKTQDLENEHLPHKEMSAVEDDFSASEKVYAASEGTTPKVQPREAPERKHEAN